MPNSLDPPEHTAFRAVIDPFFTPERFDDFAVALGGGADIVLARHLALRPDVTVLVATTRSDTRAVPVYGLQLAYLFESHPVTTGR